MRRVLVLMMFPTLILLAQCLPAQQHEPQVPGASSGGEIAGELKQIRVQLMRIEKRVAAAIPAEESVKVNVCGSYALGQKDAPVTLVEFADYQCPFCRQFHARTLQKLRKDYIDRGKVRFVALNLPLDIHADAFKAAEAALCAGEQSKFWEMQDLLVTNSNELGNDATLSYAEKLGLDKVLFRSCVESDRYAAKVRGDAARADDLDISSTPTFVLGRRQDEEVEGVKLVGAQSYSRLQTLIQGLLDSQP